MIVKSQSQSSALAFFDALGSEPSQSPPAGCSGAKVAKGEPPRDEREDPLSVRGRKGEQDDEAMRGKPSKDPAEEVDPMDEKDD